MRGIKTLNQLSSNEIGFKPTAASATRIKMISRFRSSRSSSASTILIKAFIGVYLLLDEIKSLLRSDTNADFHLFFHYRRHKIVPSFPVQYIQLIY